MKWLPGTSLSHAINAAAAAAATSTNPLACLPLCSWGPATGDKGFFRVKYGVCGMMTAGDTFGVFYLPDNLKTLEVAGTAPSRQGKKCYVYRVSGAGECS
jgi:hypothetical protein